ncbi:AAA domain-containing protein, putative AbiEii toxin, Type IV TA system [Lentzea fradiae]|uniref:AAA domain-containing protein, putative AbiEii toxin, Type IV TA system n=2 Tax=Lentzea fradiae TaxID=200378 RepID=A0A1G7TC71_9PSEU|nr:AAA domain-containing protein, putative AbiEii toxin, Type IV TA system [Lentzea fradiae]
MLRSFRLGNHRSFLDEHELLLMPAYSKDRLALPVTAIYGANASGKSNLLDGLRFMAEAVRDSFGVWKPGAGCLVTRSSSTRRRVAGPRCSSPRSCLKASDTPMGSR